MARTAQAESAVKLSVMETKSVAGETPHLDFSASFKIGSYTGNSGVGSLSAEGEAQAIFPQLGIAIKFDRNLKPIIENPKMARELQDMARMLSKALAENLACKEFMREHDFSKKRLD